MKRMLTWLLGLVAGVLGLLAIVAFYYGIIKLIKYAWYH